MKSILAVAAHPDDESFLFGGTLAMHARAGGRVGLLCATDGQAGRTADLCTREELGPFRRRELKRAVATLGIPELFTSGLMDGALAAFGDEAGAALVADVADRFDADVLLTFGPEGASGHEDHKAVYRWTLAAARERRVYVAAWPEDAELPRENHERPLPPTAVVDVSALGDLKRRAFLEHKTQQYHLETFDKAMSIFGGNEYYHRLRPACSEGEPLETSVVGVD